MDFSNHGSVRSSALNSSMHSFTADGKREPPHQNGGETALVNQLRKELSKVEQEKSEIELTLMNQMSNLAYENQATIDSLRTNLAQSEQMIETLQAASASSSSSNSSSFEVQQLKRSLEEERQLRKSAEEERDARSQELEKVKEQRDASETKVQAMQQRVGDLESSNAYLSNQVRNLEAEKQDSNEYIQSLKAELSNIEQRHEIKVSSLEQLHTAALEDANRSHQVRVKNMEREFKQQMSQGGKSQLGNVGHLQNQVAALEEEKESLAQQVDNLQVELQDEHFKNQVLEQSLSEEKARCSELWYSLEENQKRCDELEEELAQQFENANGSTDLKAEKEMLSNQIAAIQEQFVSEQEKANKLKTALDNERATNAKLKESLRDHQSRYEGMNRNLRRSHSGMGLVNGKVSTLEKEKASLTEQVAKLKEQLEQQSNQEQSNMAGRRQSDAAALESAQLELQSVMNSYQSDVARLEENVRSAQEQLTERNRQYQRLEAEINEERRIRKSLTAQLTQLKSQMQGGATDSDDAANTSNSSITSNKNSRSFSNGSNHGIEGELEHLRKENIYLTDQLKILSRNSKVDPAEVEFLRKQNRMLGERATGVHADELKELERLREQTKKLTQELNDLRSRGAEPPSNRIASQSAELERLKKQNKALNEELNALKQRMDTEEDSASCHSPRHHDGKLWARKNAGQPPTSPRSSRSLGSGFQQKVASPGSTRSLGASRHTPSSPSPRSDSFANGVQTPPLSPPLRKKPSSNGGKKESPRTPVRGIVESFERRISRTNSCSSLASLGAEAQAHMNAQSQATTLSAAAAKLRADSQSQNTVSASEIEDIRRELDEEKGRTQALETKYKKEVEMVEKLREELLQVEDGREKRAELEKLLQEREEESMCLQAKVDELEKQSQEVEALREEISKMEDYKQKKSDLEGLLQQRESERKELQVELEEKTMEAHILREELSKMEESATERDNLDRTLEEREIEIKDLRGKVEELQDIALKVDDYRQALENEKASVTSLQEQLTAESELVSSLREENSQQGQNDTARSDLEKECRESEDEIKKLRSKVGELEVMLANAVTSDDQGELDKVRGELAQADVARQDFEKKIYEDSTEMERLKSELASAEQRLDQSQKELLSLKDEYFSCRSARDELEQKSREDEELIERLQAELGAARMGLEKSLDEMERMKMGVSSNFSTAPNPGGDAASSQHDGEEIERLKAELLAAKEALDVNVAEMENLHKCVKEADASRMIALRQNRNSQLEGQQEIEKLSSELSSEKASNQNKEEEISRLREQVTALQQELQDALNYVEDLKTIISNIKNAHDSELQDVQNIEKRTNRTMGTEVNTLKVELTKNQMDRADMEREYMGKIHHLEATIEKMQEETETELEDKTKQIHDLQQTVNQKEEEVRRLEKEREQICSSMNNIASSRKDEMDQLQEELLTLTSKTATQAREIQSLKMQLEEHEFRKSEFERLKERIEELEEELRRVPTKRGDAVSQSHMEILKKENKMLRESVRDISMERRTLQEKVDALLQESSSKSTQVLRDRNAILKKEVERLTKRLKKMEHHMTRFTI